MRRYLVRPLLFYRCLRRRTCIGIPLTALGVMQMVLMFLPGILRHVQFTFPLAASIAVFSFASILAKCLFTTIFFVVVSAGSSGRITVAELKYFLSASIFCHAALVAGKVIGGVYGVMRWGADADRSFQFVRTVNLHLLLDGFGVRAPAVFEQLDLFAVLFMFHSAAALKGACAASFSLLAILSSGHWLATVTAQNLLLRAMAERW